MCSCIYFSSVFPMFHVDVFCFCQKCLHLRGSVEMRYDFPRFVCDLSGRNLQMYKHFYLIQLFMPHCLLESSSSVYFYI
jgi:hypothetical protein